MTFKTKTWMTLTLAAALSMTPVTPASAGRHRNSDPFGTGEASEAAVGAVIGIAAAITGGLALTGLTIWYLVSHSRKPHPDVPVSSLQASGALIAHAQPCVDSSGSPALACW